MSSMVYYFYVRKTDRNIHVSDYLRKNKYRKDKPETNEIGYLKGESRIGVKRMGEWKWDKKMKGETFFSECSICYSSDL